ncbi:MAG: cell wall hydrolase [Lachnospiraceae bacterium]|nr:cell wall hydrolase [Lachnospiraceae bacterium]
MKTNSKITVGILTLIAVLFVSAGSSLMHVEASASSAKTCLDCYNSGVAALLDPTNCETEKTARLVTAKEEISYELVMSNVTNTLNVREEPTTEAQIAGKLYRDCGAVVLERQDGWTKIKSGNLIGWAKDEYLFFGEEAEKEALRVGYSIAVVESDAIRVRAEANTDAKSLGFAAKGESLIVISEVDEAWLCVEYGEEIGYILREHVSEEFLVDQGESMDEITERKMKEEADKKKLVKYYGSMSASEYELLLLSALIYCEAGGESYEGKLAVGAVVCNRVRSASYQDTLQGVIYASGQFTPAMSGKVDRVMASGKIPQSCVDAAVEALGGYTNVGDCLYFRRNNGTREGIVIGNHVFY